MGGAPLLLTLAALSIDYGVRPDGADGYQYIVQVAPDQLEEQIELESVVDPRIRGQVTSIVIRVSSGPLPEDVLDPGEIAEDRAVRPAVAYTQTHNAQETQSRRPESDPASGPGTGFTLPPRASEDPPTMSQSESRAAPQSAAEPAPASAPPNSQGQSSAWATAPSSQRQNGNPGSADASDRTISQGVANPDGTLTRQSVRDSGQWRGFEADPRVAQADQRNASAAGPAGRSENAGSPSGYSTSAADPRSGTQPRYASGDPRAQNAANPYGRDTAAPPQYDGPQVTRPTANSSYGNSTYDRPADNLYAGGAYAQAPPAYAPAPQPYAQQPAYGQQTIYPHQAPSHSGYAGVQQTPVATSAGGPQIPSLPTVQAPVRDAASEAQQISPLDRNDLRLAQRDSEGSLLTSSRRSSRDDDDGRAESVPSSYQPFSQRALNGMLLISIVLNAFFLINILKLYHRHRDLVHNVRSSTPASS